MILIDEEKELVLDQAKIVKYLEETCFDYQSVLAQPNLVIVPSRLD